MPKAHVIGVPFIAIAVALPSFVAFIVTQQNGVDSIDTLSLRLANATMYSVSSRIRKRLQDEPETEIRAAKRTLELGVRTLEKKDDAYWIRRSHDWVLSSGIFTGAMNILVLDDAGPYGGGIAVDAPGGVILYYSPPTFYTQSMDTNSIPTGPLVGPRNLLLNTRPYVTVFEDDAELTANEPRWTDVEVTVTGTGLANSGLFSSISIPVFFPGQAPSRESFYAVSVLLFWLNIIDLSPYLLSEGSSILIIDSDRQLVVSTDHEQPFFQSGNASDGSPVYTTYHLYNCRVPKLEATDAILGNLSQFNDEDDHFDKVKSGVEMGNKKGGVLVAANTEDAEYAWGTALDLIGVCPGAKVAVVCTVPWAESARHLVVLSNGNHQDVWAKYCNVTPPTVSCKTVAPGQPTTQVCLFQVRAAYVHATTWETAMKAGQSVRIMAKKAAEAEGLRMDWSSVFTKVHRRQGVCEVSVRVPVEDVPKLLRSSGKAGTFWKAMSFVNGTDTLPAVWVSDCALEEARQIAARTPNTFGVIGGAKTGVFGIRTTPEHVAATESAVGKKLSKRQRRGDKYIVTTACPAEHPSDLLAACAAAEWKVEPVGSFKRRGDTVCVVIADQGPPAPVLYRLDRASISIRKYDRSIDARQRKGFTTQCQRVKINLPREFLASLQERPEPVPGQKRSRASDETTTQDKVARLDTADNMATDCRHANWQESYENDKAFLCEVCCKLTINVTSLLKNVLLLCGIVADIICLQETKLTSTGQKKIRMALKECAALDVWQPFFGSCCEGRKCGNDVPSQITGGSAGVAILVRKGLPACVVSPFDVVEERAYEAARFLHVRVATGSGKGALHVVSLYGHCGHSARIEREKLVEGVLWGMRRRLGAVPIVVAGDLNTDPLNSPALRFALRNGWTDCAELHAKSLNRPPEHTCYHGEPSRIDLVLTNEIASSALGNVETFEAGFPTHKAIRAVFHLTAFQQLNAVFRFPRAIPGSGLTDRTDTAALKAVVAKYRLADPCPRGLEGSQRVDFLWLRISRAAEDYLLQKSKIEGNLAAYRGRGERRRLSTQRVSARPSPEGAGADTAPLKRARCLLGRMREYSAARAKWEDMSSAPCPLSLLLKGQWDKIRSFQSFILQRTDGKCALPLVPPSAKAARGLSHTISDVCQSLAQTTLNSRYLEIARCQRELRNPLGKESFAWVKKEAPPTFYFTNGRDGRLTANLVEVDATVRRKWDPVLRMYAGKKEPEFAPFLREYGDFIAQHPCQLGPITADRLRSVARKKGVQSSCGVDGWRMREVAALPDTILEGFAAVLNEVEETGLWPDGVLDALVTLIPKGEGDDPLKLRPITVSSVVYRLWASVRLQEVLVWQEQWIHESQHGFRKGHSCDDVIMDIALSIEESLINGTPLHGIALDFAKCFDRVPQGLVLDLVEALGLHERVLAPLRHVYKYLRRRFKYPLGVGDEFKVTNGILQGCPISVVLINALLSVLSKALVSRARVSPKSFADDLYLLSRLAKLLQEGIDVTAIFGNLTGLALNEGKCAAFSTSKKGPRLEVGGKAMKSVKTVKIRFLPAKRHSFELLSFEGATVPFSGKEALHFVREGLRLRAWRYLTTQRQGYSGIERGVDVRLLNRLWQNRATGDRLSFAIRKCIAGAVYSREWCNRRWGTGDGVCEFCDGGTPGTLLHYFWECPGPGGRWVNLHCRLDVAGVAAQNMPLCLSTRGIPPIGTPPVLVERVQKLIGTISIEMAQAQHNIATTRPWELASAAAGRYDVELARDSRELLTKQIGTRFAASLVTSGGDTYWVTMKTVVHYNRRWFILMWTPEKTFFAQIDAANEKTLITVVMLVIGCTLVAAVLGYLATLPLKTLARAFDKVADMDLDHPDVNAVKHTQFISELDSLHNGFWHAVQMVKQVKAFLPIRDETSGAETESTPRDIIHCSSPSGADNPIVTWQVAATFYGILGSKSQRFNVIGSEIVDTAALLASYATRMELTPAVLLSGSMIEYLKSYCYYMIDDDFDALGTSIKMYWVEKNFVAETEEWMYELAQEAEQKKAFLDRFFGLVQKEMFTEADEYLNGFLEDHRMFDRHTVTLRRNLNDKRAATKLKTKVIHSKKGKPELIVEVFALGIKVSWMATLLVASFEGFCNICLSDASRALSVHSDLFQRFSESAKVHRGVVSGLQGNRFLVAWNTSRPCQVASSKVNSVSMVFDIMAAINCTVSFGLHHAPTFYGILGSKSQRFNVVGSEIVDTAALLASYATRMVLTPSVLMSGSMIEYLENFVFYMIDDDFRAVGSSIKLYWVEKRFVAKTDEWMYELARLAEQKEAFLDPFFGFVQDEMFTEADEYLNRFSEDHRMFDRHVALLRSNLDKRRAAAKKSNMSRFLESSPSLTAAFGG
ncbi:Retrovirus-related Pol polyprotein from type-2 retrotransposable element R2DM [Diplonema papillatum]|nr:Retrovirus-related Pol polyprotein from type-2 retrotransposable element R2DM [Diplonema papillatum]